MLVTRIKTHSIFRVFMGKTFYDFREIPIPSFAKVNKANNTVYVLLNSRNARGDFKRRNIGKRANVNTMYVNGNFRQYYPELWNTHYGHIEEAKNDFLHCGLYVAALGILKGNGLYETLLESFGPKISNALIDFSLYAIHAKSNVALTYSSVMENQALFSKSVYSDSWYSDLFHTLESEKRRAFLEKWLEVCKKRGMKEVWLSIDGSNNDCTSSYSTLATPGHSKSGKSTNIISYMYAVDTATGIPITYDAYYGSIVDKTEIIAIVKYLKDHDISVKGIILDRGFCTQNALDAIKDLGCRYIVMANSDTHAYEYMVSSYSSTIRWKTDYILNRKGIFGIKDKTKPFAASPESCYAYLFFDASNGTERALTLIEKVMDAREEAIKTLEKGKEPKLSKEMNKYLILEKDEKGRTKAINYNHIAWQENIDAKGFSVILSSDDLPPSEVDRLYNLRDVSEKVYASIKTQLGFSVTRTKGDDAILNKMALLFIATILRQEFVNSAESVKIPTNLLVAELDKVHMILSSSSLSYYVPHKESGRVSSFLSLYGIDSELIETIVDEYNDRDKNLSLERYLPKKEKKNGPGRPKTKKKEEPISTAIKRGPGRPKGSKNKKTLLKEHMLTESLEPKAPKKRGRPRKEHHNDFSC